MTGHVLIRKSREPVDLPWVVTCRGFPVAACPTHEAAVTYSAIHAACHRKD